MQRSLLLVVDEDPARRDALTEALGSEFFSPLPLDPGAVEGLPAVSYGVVALSLLGGPGLLDTARAWLPGASRNALLVAAVVADGDEKAEEAAWSAGVDEVLPWPARGSLLRAKLRGLENVIRLRREVVALDGVITAVVTAFEAREPHTIEHGKRVALLASAMGTRLGLGEETCERMRRGALLHDIGILVLPDRVLHQQGPLEGGTLDEVRSHPVAGYELLRGAPSLEPVLPYVHRHHERIDGSGFPDGLRGAEIPLPIQVVSLADAYDSLTSSRPYRSVFSQERALGTLADEARRGTWDEELLRTLAETLGSEGGEGSTGSGR